MRVAGKVWDWCAVGRAWLEECDWNWLDFTVVHMLCDWLSWAETTRSLGFVCLLLLIGIVWDRPGWVGICLDPLTLVQSTWSWNRVGGIGEAI